MTGMGTLDSPPMTPRADAADSIHTPVEGRLVRLRTRAEVQASNETTPAYIIEVPNRSANSILNILRDVVPSEVTSELQHLRRFAKPEYLPPHLAPIHELTYQTEELPSTPLVPAVNGLTSHLLICLSSAVDRHVLEALFKKEKDLFEPLTSAVREIEVPMYAPTSAAQAVEWSSQYWPTTYKNTNPYGPHPALVGRAETELLVDNNIEKYMNLAAQVAEESKSMKHGPGIGAVVVERFRLGKEHQSRVATVAGDARYRGITSENGVETNAIETCNGNVMAHAVLRAIDMIAETRLILSQPAELDVPPKLGLHSLNSHSPLTPLESHYLSVVDRLTPNGYLCLDLELYVTHEPCVMCTMAILHSRFGRIVYGQPMLTTGALNAEPGSLGYGLHWREQLNWKCLAWRWEAESYTKILKDKIFVERNVQA